MPPVPTDLVDAYEREVSQRLGALTTTAREGGLVPTNRIALRDAVLHGDHTLAELGGDPPLEHSAAVAPEHPGGERLSEVADVVLDNLAPYGDATLDGLGGLGGVAVGAVSSITAAYISQLLTVATVAALVDRGVEPPVYLSANIPGGDEHDRALEARYAGRIRRGA